MKRMEWLLLAISFIVQPVHTSYFHSIKTLWARASNALPTKRTCAITGGTSLLIGSGLYYSMQEQDDSANLDYSINLMWINRNLQTDQLYIHPSPDKASFKENFLDNALKWGAVNNTAKVNLWYDGALISPEAVQNTKKMIALQSLKHWRMASIELKNVRELPDVQRHPEVFSAKTPVYFRVDLLRACAAIHTVSIPQPTYFVYADIDMQPLSRKELFDKATLDKLKQYGIVMAHGGSHGFENGFQIISNQNPRLIKAMRTAIIQVNIKRAYNALCGNFYTAEYRDTNNPMRELQQIVYDSYPKMFGYFWQLEGLGELRLHGKKYDPFFDGLEAFNLNCRAQRMAYFSYETQTLKKPPAPTKKVPLPPPGYNYD